MPTKRGITIFFVPHNRKKSLSMHLEGWQVSIGLIATGVAILLFVIGVVGGGRAVKLIAENRSLQAQNEILRQERVKIAQLESELEKTSQLRKWMESMVIGESAKEEITAQTASMASPGFLSLLNRPFETKLIPELERETEIRLRRMDFIPRGLPVVGAVTAEFGDMGGRFLAPHSGVDIAAPTGSIVKATAAGIVAQVENDPQLGLVVIIDHLNGFCSKFGHLSNSVVVSGDWVERNDRIGIVGESGHARGPHVHYELSRDGELVNPMATRTNISSKEG